MSSTSLEVVADNKGEAGSGSLDPFHNPSYPRREHIAERAQLEESLHSCDTRIAAIRVKLNSLGNLASRPTYERLYHQMLGARDQVAESVRRIPLETGGLYREDTKRYERALAALDRVLKKWDQVTG